MDKKSSDNRRYFRRGLVARIDVLDGYLDAKLHFNSHNISAGGIFLESELLFEEGETIWLSFTLPGAPVEIRSRGKVVWVNKPEESNPDNPAGMGIEFLDISLAERAALEAFLKDD